jgi:hypothetical protein
MEESTTNAKRKIKKGSVARPFRPSWVNHFNNWIGRLPGTSWPYYFGLWLVLSIVPSSAYWIEGALRPGTFYYPVEIYMAAVMSFLLMLMSFLDRRAGIAFEALGPALKTTDEERQDLQYRITHLPSGGALLGSLLTIGIILLTEAYGTPYVPSWLVPFPFSLGAFRVIYFLGWWVFGAFLYHTLHQLGMINRIYTQKTTINLFRIKPLYAFSNLTALTAGSLTLVTYAWRAIDPYTTQDLATLVIMMVILLLAFLTFIWPQLGIHGLQVAEKDRLIEEANQRFEATILELHKRVDAGKLEKIGELSTTLSALEKELTALKKIPTWPWQPETVRWLVTALVLPLGLWIIQVVLQRFLGA